MGVAIATGEVRWRGRGEDGLAGSPSWKDGMVSRAAVSRRSPILFSGEVWEGTDGALGRSRIAIAISAPALFSFR